MLQHDNPGLYGGVSADLLFFAPDGLPITKPPLAALAKISEGECAQALAELVARSIVRPRQAIVSTYGHFIRDGVHAAAEDEAAISVATIPQVGIWAPSTSDILVS